MANFEDSAVPQPKIPQEWYDKYSYLTDPLSLEKAVKASYMMHIKGKLKGYFPEDNDWDIAQQTLQEVQSVYLVQDPDIRFTANARVVEDYRKFVAKKYEHEPELRDALLICTPSLLSLSKWFKNPKWNDAVWKRMKDSTLFTPEKRTAMINALYKKGVSGDTSAAKIWLTLSGDYSDKMDIKSDSTVEKYKEFNKILHLTKPAANDK
jgi:hypothetical protein